MPVDTVAEIKRKIDLVEHIGRVTTLHKAGRNFRALCPFHQEKTPSFYVFPDRATWRCFGSCGEGGDLFSFVQKRENLDFRGALRLLATEAGVQLSPEAAARRSRTDQLGAIMSAAVDFYQRQYQEPGGAAARAYIEGKRGITLEAVQAFRIGWAPDDWRTLRDYLDGRGYAERDVIAAGLLVEPEAAGNPYDRFRGRAIIPIADERGLYIAMGGRGLQGEQPKYLNSPQTELFDKGRTLFGLHLAHEAIRQTGTVVVVEGYMDVIGPWQAGFRNVVATMGTSLTEHHVEMLKRFAKRIVLAMDPDAAGLAAAERAGSMLLGLDNPLSAAQSVRAAEALTGPSEIDLRVAPLPPGKDPDEVAREDPETWRRAIDEAIPFAEFVLKRVLGSSRPTSPIEARRLIDKVTPVLRGARDSVNFALYVGRVAQHLGVPEVFVFDRLRETGRPVPRGRPPEAEPDPYEAESKLLAIFVRHPALRSDFRSLPAPFFTRATDREIFLHWAHEGPQTVPSEDDPLLPRLRELQALRLPPLTTPEAAREVRHLTGAIGRQRFQEHQGAVTESLAVVEQELGANRLADISHATWQGRPPAIDDHAAAELVIEDLQLGLSIHRREAPDRP